MEDLLSMSNKQLTELINQAEQIRKERLKQEKKNIIKDLRDIISKAEDTFLYIFDILDGASITKVWANILKHFGEWGNPDKVINWFWKTYEDEISYLGSN